MGNNGQTATKKIHPRNLTFYRYDKSMASIWPESARNSGLSLCGDNSSSVNKWLMLIATDLYFSPTFRYFAEAFNFHLCVNL